VKLFLSGLALGAVAACFPQVALWICGLAAVFLGLGFVAFIGLVAYLHAGEPREERP
jgi:hypothetical protein